MFDKLHLNCYVHKISIMNSINKKEIEKFSKIAEEWWNPNGKFRPLHNFNPIRIKYIRDNLIKDFKVKSFDKPLKNIKILDIGCGGGLLSEPMCRLGANVVGIDASKKNIEVAKFHAKKNKLKIDYKVASPEKLKTKQKFDVVLNMEIVEHVDDINFFIKKSSELLKKNGVMFIATLNKTLKSYAFAIIGAEYVLKWLPIGTHDWEKFVKPDDLINISKKNNLVCKKLDGMKFNILDNSWKVSVDTSVNYLVKLIKE
jgi:2-polyprenyl-6-hydroxyphenyl methylase / 3-demethylubiquinone-9 3-methyltransferase